MRTWIKRITRLGIFSILGYIPIALTFFVGADDIYWYTSAEANYGGYYAKEINSKFDANLINEKAKSHTSQGGSIEYDDRDIDRKTLFVRNNSSSRAAGPGDVKLIFCPMPEFFVERLFEFSISRNELLDDDCGEISNTSVIIPKHALVLHYFAKEFPKIYQDSTSSANLVSGEFAFELHIALRFLLFLGGFAISASLGVSLFQFIWDYLNEKFQLNSKNVLIRYMVAAPLLLIPLLSVAGGVSMIAALVDFELISDYDKSPNLLSSDMQLVKTPASRSELINRAVQGGKRNDAYQLHVVAAKEIETAETMSIGGPGLATAFELNSVSWHALLAGKPEDALTAANRAIQLAPKGISFEANRDHALALLGRTDEALRLYLSRKGALLQNGAL